MTALTPAQREARRNSRLDQRCRACGATSAASDCCYSCLSTDLEYREHLPGPKPGTVGGIRPVQWCQQGEVRRDADPVRRARALAARVPPQQSENAADAIGAVDGAAQQGGLGL